MLWKFYFSSLRFYGGITIASDRAGKILNTLDASGWQQDDDNVLSVSYTNYRAFIWQNEQGSWSFSVATITGDPIAGEYVNNISEVKRETASALADLFSSDYLVPPCFLFPCASTMGMACMADIRPGYRGMGLYEVLRALMIAKGSIEIRTGRVYAYRTFLEGDMRIQLEPKNSDSRPGMPKAVLLDAERKFVTVPTNHEALSGSAVRVIFPLL